MRAGEIPSEIQPESAEPDLERKLQNVEVGLERAWHGA